MRERCAHQGGEPIDARGIVELVGEPFISAKFRFHLVQSFANNGVPLVSRLCLNALEATPDISVRPYGKLIGAREVLRLSRETNSCAENAHVQAGSLITDDGRSH